jgi:2-oxoisovalerate dehydrogenase E2 component (dihydrolipoyl transacylase)
MAHTITEHVIKMPDLGEGIAEVEVVAWRVQPGDAVREDQILADVMTDKATVEIPSPVAGTVLALGGKAGEALPVGAPLIRIDLGGSSAGAAAAPAVPAPVTAPAPAEATFQPAAGMPPAPAPAPAAAEPARQPPIAADRPLAAPAVRKRAWDLGIELRYVPGTGPAGRITHADLDAWLAGGRRAPSSPAADGRYAALDGEEAVPITGLRRRIAERMQLAKRQIPHFTYVEEVDVTELEALRGRLNSQYGDTRGKLTLLPLLMRAIVLAVRRFPDVNARFDDGANVVTRYQPVHIGIATQTDAGLMVPVVRNAEARDPWQNAAEIARLAEAARTAKAAREDLGGSTLTITSLGALGGIVSTPVINHPEVAIVGVNRIVDRPVVRDGGLVARKMMNLSSSFDHRIIDGAVAAGFIQAVRGYLECPALLFVE